MGIKSRHADTNACDPNHVMPSSDMAWLFKDGLLWGCSQHIGTSFYQPSSNMGS